MKYHAFLIKYAEIGIKGKNRYLFEDALVKHIRLAMERVEGEFEVKKESGRIYVQALSDYDYDEAVRANEARRRKAARLRRKRKARIRLILSLIHI